MYPVNYLVLNMKKLLTAFFLISFILGQGAIAEDGVVCAAVYPCDDNGNLLDEYSDSQSPCLDYYIGQCLVTKLQISKQSIQTCEFQKSDLEATIESMNSTERKYLRLKKKLKELRSSRQ